LVQTWPEGNRPLSAKTLMLFGLWVMALTDEMRSGALTYEMVKSQK
jgi:hypothetical protein